LSKAGNTFTNSGTITAIGVGKVYAIYGAGDDNAQTINLLSGSNIQGSILLGDGGDIFTMSGGTITGNVDLADGANVVNVTKGTINGIFDIGAATANPIINPSTGNIVSFLNPGATALESEGLNFAMSGTGTVIINGNVVDSSGSKLANLDHTAGTLRFVGNSAIDGALNSQGAGSILDIGQYQVTVAQNSIIGVGGSMLKISVGGSLVATYGVTITFDPALIIYPMAIGDTSGQAIIFIDGDENTLGTMSISDVETLQNNMVTSLRMTYTLGLIGQDMTITAAKNSGEMMAEMGLSENAVAVNTIVDQAFSSDPNMMNGFNGITEMPVLNAALKSLAPTVDGGAVVGSVSAGTAATQTVSTRLASLRTGIPAGQGLASGDALAGDRNFWMQGFGTFADQKERQGFDGFDALTAGYAFGVDKPFGKNLTGGLSFSYAATTVNSDSSANKTLIDSYQATGYGSYKFGHNFLDGMVSVAYNNYDGVRNISVGGVEEKAKADYWGIQSSIKAELGREIRFDNGVTMTPSVSLQYNHLSINNYTETEADTANLNVDNQKYDSLFLTLKSKFSRSFDIKAGTMAPEVHIGYMYEALDEKVLTTSTFTGGGGSFKTTGFDPANHSLLAGVGFSFLHNNNYGVTGIYDMERKQDYISHSFLIKGEVKF